MKLLALDTSTTWCSVAAGDGTHWYGRDEIAVDSHSERALALVDAVLAQCQWRLTDLDGIAFGAGPGSFTGLRVACGIAQGLALGADLPLVPVPTLLALALAAGTAHDVTRVVACLDARMREVYVAAVQRREAGWVEVEAARVVAPAAIAPPPGMAWLGAGNGFAAYPDLGQRLGLAGVDAEARPTAQAVGALALPRLAAGEGVAPADALPLYVRHRVALTVAERTAGKRL
jgi:tRNA threonylcarbamoyladenosine biosynthesis protein TsaB